MTPDQLIACGIDAKTAEAFAAPLTAACDRFTLTVRAQAMLVGQCIVESSAFQRLEEGLDYTHADRILAEFGSHVGGGLDVAQTLVGRPQALANRVYAGRFGNGDEASGDGWRYRGRGLIGLTFRENYRKEGMSLGADYEGQPDLVAQPEDACLTAVWYIVSRGLVPAANAGLVDQVTHGINPAMDQAQRRRDSVARCLKALGVA